MLWIRATVAEASTVLTRRPKLAKRHILRYSLKAMKTMIAPAAKRDINFVYGSRYAWGICEKRKSALSQRAKKYDTWIEMKSQRIRHAAMTCQCLIFFLRELKTAINVSRPVRGR